MDEVNMADVLDQGIGDIANDILLDAGVIDEADIKKTPDAPQSSAKQGQGDDPENQSELDFGDMPNGQLRYEKLKSQREKSDAENSDLRTRLAKMEGKLEVLKGSDDKEPEVDPTEHMTDTEKFLYGQNQKLIEAMQVLQGSVNSHEKDSVITKLSKKESAFFASNPKLAETREQVVEAVTDLFKERPVFKKMFRTGEIELSELYAMISTEKATSNAPKKQRAQDPDRVFRGKETPASPGGSSFEDDDQFAKASGILRDRNSTNKAEAVSVLENIIAEDIASLIDSD